MQNTLLEPAKKKWIPPAAGRGRKKGELNKVTRSVKDAITMAAEKLGGVDRLVEWAKENPDNERLFWGTIYPKLLPFQVNAKVEHAGEAVTRVVITRATADGNIIDATPLLERDPPNSD